MLKIALLECILIVALTFQISRPTQSNLGFSNYTASGVTQDQVSNFISFVNSAASLYDYDIQKHIQYIVSQMNIYVGTTTERYSVLIQGGQDESGNYVYSINGTNIASRTSINPKRPTWSYLFYRYTVGGYYSYENYIFHLQKGTGFSDSDANLINSIIVSTQPSGYCDCSVTYLIGQKLATAFSKDYYLSVVCEVSQSTTALVSNYNQMWIYTSPKQCYYTIWAYPE